MVNSSDFVDRLEKILEYYNLNASALAEKINFNRSTISHLLSGRNKPSLEFVIKLHQQFPEIDTDWLLFGTGNFPSLPEEGKLSAEKKNLNLFSEVADTEERATVKNENNKMGIEKIIIFYEDGSFKVYQN